MSQIFSLKWNDHMGSITKAFKNFFLSEQMVDVTLACDGHSLKVHKMILSACSPFFRSLLSENPCKHPIVVLTNVKYTELKAIIDFMYDGEVNVAKNQLPALIKTAESLRIKGLTEITDGDDVTSTADKFETVSKTISAKRKRIRTLSKSNQCGGVSSEPNIKDAYTPETKRLPQNVNTDMFEPSDLPPLTPMQTTSSHSSNFFKTSHKEEHEQSECSVGNINPLAKNMGSKPPSILETTIKSSEMQKKPNVPFIESNLSTKERRIKSDHRGHLVSESIPPDTIVPASQQIMNSLDTKPDLSELGSTLSKSGGHPHKTDQNCKETFKDQSVMSELHDASSLSESRANCQALGALRCFYCSYSTSQLNNLKIHVRTHTGEKPYGCRFCSKQFAVRCNLLNHMKIHTGDKPYACRFCDYKCIRKSTLDRHTKIHTGEKPYACRFCDYKSIQKKDLERHITIHAGGKPQYSVYNKEFT